MAVPDFQNLMLPLLKVTADHVELSIGEAVESLAQQLNLSDDDRKELLPSGRQRRFDNRVGWAKAYLQKAGLLLSKGRSRFSITERGITILHNNVSAINIRFLEQFPEFMAFRANNNRDHRTNGAVDTSQEIIEKTNQTPQEILEASYQSLRRNLAHELLECVKNNSPKFFENLVVDLLVSMGYGGSRKDAGQAIGQTGDEGIDGIIKEDKLGLDTIYLQAKRWEGDVSRPTVQGFAGALLGKKAKKGILITTSSFSKPAREYAENAESLKIILIDGEQLAQFMIDYDIGVNEESRYIVKKVDLDYFEDE